MLQSNNTSAILQPVIWWWIWNRGRHFSVLPKEWSNPRWSKTILHELSNTAPRAKKIIFSDCDRRQLCLLCARQQNGATQLTIREWSTRTLAVDYWVAPEVVIRVNYHYSGKCFPWLVPRTLPLHFFFFQTVVKRARMADSLPTCPMLLQQSSSVVTC